MMRNPALGLILMFGCHRLDMLQADPGSCEPLESDADAMDLTGDTVGGLLAVPQDLNVTFSSDFYTDSGGDLVWSPAEDAPELPASYQLQVRVNGDPRVDVCTNGQTGSREAAMLADVSVSLAGLGLQAPHLSMGYTAPVSGVPRPAGAVFHTFAMGELRGGGDSPLLPHDSQRWDLVGKANVIVDYYVDAQGALAGLGQLRVCRATADAPLEPLAGLCLWQRVD